MIEDMSKSIDLRKEEEKAQYIPEDTKGSNPHKAEITLSQEEFQKLQDQIAVLSKAFVTTVVHPPQPVVPAQAAITSDSNAAKKQPAKEVILEEVDSASLFKQNPWHVGAKVRVSDKYPEIQGKVSWKGRVGNIQRILKDPSGVKMVEVAFNEVQVPFVRPHPTKAGVSQRGYRIEKAVQTFDDSCLEPVYE